MSSKFKCPHCDEVLKKSPAMKAMSRGGFIFTTENTMPCPNCGRGIHLESALQGKYDAKPWWHFGREEKKSEEDVADFQKDPVIVGNISNMSRAELAAREMEMMRQRRVDPKRK